MNIIGIDVSKSKLDCALIDHSNHRKLRFKVVSNSEEGFVTLIDWLAKRTKSSISAYHFIMAARDLYKSQFRPDIWEQYFFMSRTNFSYHTGWTIYDGVSEATSLRIRFPSVAALAYITPHIVTIFS